MSRRDQVNVAWSGSGRTRKCALRDPSRRERCESGAAPDFPNDRTFATHGMPRLEVERYGRSRDNHTVPYGTDLWGAPLLAINCQATFISSLRDRTSHVSPITSHVSREAYISQVNAVSARSRETSRGRVAWRTACMPPITLLRRSNPSASSRLAAIELR